MLIHIKKNTEVLGPYTIEEVREYLSVGKLSMSDLARLPCSFEWIPLASIPDIKSAPPPPTVSQKQSGPPERPLTTSPQQKKQSDDLISWRVVRDLFIVIGMQAVGIFIVCLYRAFAGEPQSNDALGLPCLIFGIVGFAISGSLAAGNRWEHLVKVAIFTTVAYTLLSTSFLNDTSFVRLLMNVAVAFLMMGLGGALSYLFKKR